MVEELGAGIHGGDGCDEENFFQVSVEVHIKSRM